MANLAFNGKTLLPTSTPRIGSLIFAHFLAIAVSRLLFTLKSEPEPFTTLPFFSLLAAQATLLGIYAAVAFQDRIRRTAVISGGIAVLWTCLTIEAWDDIPGEIVFYTIMLIAMPTLAVFLSTILVGKKGMALVEGLNASDALLHESLQFSIKHVFVLTAAVAGLITLGKAVRWLYEQLVWTDGDTFVRVMVFIAIMTTCYVALALGCLWACLGTAQPFGRIAIVMLMAFFMSAIPLYYFPLDRLGTILIGGSTFLEAVIVTASLLVVRSAGYRLVRPPRH